MLKNLRLTFLIVESICWVINLIKSERSTFNVIFIFFSDFVKFDKYWQARRLLFSQSLTLHIRSNLIERFRCVEITHKFDCSNFARSAKEFRRFLVFELMRNREIEVDSACYQIKVRRYFHSWFLTWAFCRFWCSCRLFWISCDFSRWFYRSFLSMFSISLSFRQWVCFDSIYESQIVDV